MSVHISEVSLHKINEFFKPARGRAAQEADMNQYQDLIIHRNGDLTKYSY